MTPTMIRALWNRAYSRGRYVGAPPEGFARRVGELLQKTTLGQKRGLYVGCGCGRNFSYLAERAPHLTGLDVSDVGLKQLTRRWPHLSGRVVEADFREYDDGRFGYIIAIRSLIHGTFSDISGQFGRAARMLDAGGVLFVVMPGLDDQHILEPECVVESTKHGCSMAKHGRIPLMFLATDVGVDRVVRDAGLVLEQKARKIGPNGSWFEVICSRPAGAGID